MKETLTSLLRHALTALAGLGTFMYSQGYMGSGRSFAPSVADVNASGAAMGNALSAIIVVLLVRLFMKFSGKLIVAHAADVYEDKKNDDRGLYGLLLLLGMVGLFGFALPSCSPAQVEAAQAVPINVRYWDKKGNGYGYSSRDGIEVDLHSGK